MFAFFFRIKFGIPYLPVTMMKMMKIHFPFDIPFGTFLIHLNLAQFLLTLWGKLNSIWYHTITTLKFKLSCATTINCFVLIVLLSPQYNNMFRFENFLNKILRSGFVSSWTLWRYSVADYCRAAPLSVSIIVSISPTTTTTTTSASLSPSA